MDRMAIISSGINRLWEKASSGGRENTSSVVFQHGDNANVKPPTPPQKP
jgi:hypothetical protein